MSCRLCCPASQAGSPSAGTWGLLLPKHFGACFNSAASISYQEPRNHTGTSDVASDAQLSLTHGPQGCFIYILYIYQEDPRAALWPWRTFWPGQHSISISYLWVPQSHTTGQRRILGLPFLKGQLSSLHTGWEHRDTGICVWLCLWIAALRPLGPSTHSLHWNTDLSVC